MRNLWHITRLDMKHSRLNYKNLFFLFSSTFLFLGVIIYINYKRITVVEYEQYLLSLTIIEQYILFFCLLVPIVLIGYNASRFMNVSFGSDREHIITLCSVELAAVLLWVIHPTISVLLHSIGLFLMGIFMGFWRNGSQNREIGVMNIGRKSPILVVISVGVLLVLLTFVIAFQYPNLYKIISAIEFALGLLSALIGHSYLSNSNEN